MPYITECNYGCGQISPARWVYSDEGDAIDKAYDLMCEMADDGEEPEDIVADYVGMHYAEEAVVELEPRRRYLYLCTTWSDGRRITTCNEYHVLPKFPNIEPDEHWDPFEWEWIRYDTEELVYGWDSDEDTAAPYDVEAAILKVEHRRAAYYDGLDTTPDAA
jgi:hypothetical protein